MRYSFILLYLLLYVQVSVAQEIDYDKFVDGLMRKMTLREKIGQLNLLPTGPVTTAYGQNEEIFEDVRRGDVGGVFNLRGVHDNTIIQRMAVEETRLGIPILFGCDVIHGYETIFPLNIALSCSWDMNAIEEMARISAREATASGIHWTFSPMVDICKDARWSRISEGAGEDPFLGAAVARAMVKGYQGNLDSIDEMMACVKHFALYGASEGGRDYNMVDMSCNRMFNEYMLPYKAAIDEGVSSVMVSFNDINGIPATANKWLLTDLLRKQWGFKGFITSDHSAVKELSNHSLGDEREVSAKALLAGVDFDMGSRSYVAQLENAVKCGLVSEADVDVSCRRILMVKAKLGLFENPYRFLDAKREKYELYSKANRAAARRIAAETFVLLKNANHLLPLSKSGRIALVGPLAHARTQMHGNWAVAAKNEKYSTIFEAMQQYLKGKAEVRYSKGSNYFYDEEMERRTWVNFSEQPHLNDSILLDDALRLAEWGDVIVAALGEPGDLSGESSCRTNLDMPDAQHDLLKALLATGKPVVLLNFAGRPTVMGWENAHVPAILHVWHPGSEGGAAICDVLFGDVSPSAKLTTSFPQSVGQEPFYYNHRATSRPQAKEKWFEKFRSNYIDCSNDAVYPFGYGLSYTTFEYSPVILSCNDICLDGGELTASVTVTNTGKYDAFEVVQLYLHDPVASITRPIKELKGFERVFLKSGESKVVSFKITTDLLKFYNANMDFVCEPGLFNIMIGTNSEDLQQVDFMVKE